MTAPTRPQGSAGASPALRPLHLCSLVPLILLAGCRPSASPAEPESWTQTAERGPYRFEVLVSPREIWFADAVTIRLRMHTPDETLVQFPSAAAFGDLDVRPTLEPIPRPTETGLVWEQTFRGEALVHGTLTIPSLSARYAPATPDGSEPEFEHELAAGPLEIEVRSALTTQDSVVSPREITGTLAPPPEPIGEWPILAAVAAILAVAGAFWWLLRRRAAAPPAAPLPAEVWALRALAELDPQTWFPAGRRKEFYYRLTEIVRAYIEKKFGLAAPEMTTEEFLTSLSRDRSALPYDPSRLREFLRACDLVKYAAFEPQPEDGAQAVGTARAFVDATAAAAASRMAAGETPVLPESDPNTSQGASGRGGQAA